MSERESAAGSPASDRLVTRAILGIAGISLGNFLIAAANAISGESAVVVAGGLIAALGTGLVALGWWRGDAEFDPGNGTLARLFPTLLLIGGVLLPVAGLGLIAIVLTG